MTYSHSPDARDFELAQQLTQERNALENQRRQVEAMVDRWNIAREEERLANLDLSVAENDLRDEIKHLPKSEQKYYHDIILATSGIGPLVTLQTTSIDLDPFDFVD